MTEERAIGGLEEQLRAAREIAQEAGDLLLSFFGTDRVAARNKGDRDLVTDADEASERMIVARLAEAFPGDGLVAEEGALAQQDASRRWYVDPLDGTVNYAHRIPIWCVSMALFEDGRPLLGVVHDPTRHETFEAIRDQGAWLNGEKIRCNPVTESDGAIVHLTVDVRDDGRFVGLEDVERLTPQVLRSRNIGAAALALAYVAAGRLDAVVHRFAHTWDYGAGVVLVEAAGGIVSDLNGHDFTSETKALLAAATCSLHSQLFGILQG